MAGPAPSEPQGEPENPNGADGLHRISSPEANFFLTA